MDVYDAGDGLLVITATDDWSGDTAAEGMTKYEALDLVNEILAVTKNLGKKK